MHDGKSKWLCILLAAMLTFGATACGRGEENTAKSTEGEATQAADTTAPETDGEGAAPSSAREDTVVMRADGEDNAYTLVFADDTCADITLPDGWTVRNTGTRWPRQAADSIYSAGGHEYDGHAADIFAGDTLVACVHHEELSDLYAGLREAVTMRAFETVPHDDEIKIPEGHTPVVERNDMCTVIGVYHAHIPLNPHGDAAEYDVPQVVAGNASVRRTVSMIFRDADVATQEELTAIAESMSLSRYEGQIAQPEDSSPPEPSGSSGENTLSGTDPNTVIEENLVRLRFAQGDFYADLTLPDGWSIRPIGTPWEKVYLDSYPGVAVNNHCVDGIHAADIFDGENMIGSVSYELFTLEEDIPPDMLYQAIYWRLRVPNHFRMCEYIPVRKNDTACTAMGTMHYWMNENNPDGSGETFQYFSPIIVSYDLNLSRYIVLYFHDMTVITREQQAQIAESLSLGRMA